MAKKKLVKRQSSERKNNLTVERGANNPTELIVQDLSLISPNRNRKDTGTLKAAIVRAESIHVPNRVALYDTYHDVMSLDGHLSGIWRKRIDAVLNKNLKVVDKNQRKKDELDSLIYSNKFNRLIEIILESKAWGISGVEFIVGEEFDYKEVPRKHIRPEQGIIVKSQYSSTGIPLEELPFVWTIGDNNDLGQLLQCVMYALYKRGGLGDLAQYVEIFGQPVRIIYYDAYDTKTKGELRTLLNESGSSLAMMIPKQAQFEMLDGKTSNGTGELQLGFMRFCNDEMSIAVLGNSETTSASKGSGYAQAKEHSKQQLEITKSDLQFVQNVLNEPQFIDILQSFGFPIEEGDSFQFEKETDLETLAERKKIDEFVATKVPISDDYWYDTYGIDKPDNYDELKREMQEKEKLRQYSTYQYQQKQKEEEPEEEPQEPTPPKEKSKAKPKEQEDLGDIIITSKERGILQKGWDILFGAKKKVSLAEYYDSTCTCCSSENLHNLSTNAFGSIYEDIAKKLLTEKLEKGAIHDGLYLEMARQLMDGVNEGLGGASFDYDDSRNVLKSYLQRNIFHFSAAKSMTELIAFRDLMLDPKTGNVRSFFEFRKKIEALGMQFNEVWLETEYDTALATVINANRFDTIDAEYLEFTTVGDERVRPEHAILDGMTYPKSDPIWRRMTPPLDYKCRCGIKPGLARNYKPEDAANDGKYVLNLVKDTIFDNNAAMSKLVFDNNHPYFSNLGVDKLKDLKYSNYGLSSIKDIQKRGGLKAISLLENLEDYDAYWNSMTNHEKGIVLKSPLGENILFSDHELTKKGKASKYFKQHITSRLNEDRYKLIANLEDVIKNPSEVWSVVNKSDREPVSNHYIKYYQDKTLLVLVVDNEARTMFELTESGFKSRQGLLLYKK